MLRKNEVLNVGRFQLPVAKACHCERGEAIFRIAKAQIAVGPPRAERGIAGHP